MARPGIEVLVFEEMESASLAVAHDIASHIRYNTLKGKSVTLGLATGFTPISVYKELIRLHHSENLSFSRVTTFNLDEYYPMHPESLNSYVRFMHEILFDHIDIPKDQIFIPDGTIGKSKISGYCLEYEKQIQRAGGIDIQLIGIGRNGHIGFNEPGSNPNSITRLVSLHKKTREDAANEFSNFDSTPKEALTMGMSTIFKAKKIYLLAWGEKKANIVKQSLEGPVGPRIPASFLQNHPNTTFVLDKSCASKIGYSALVKTTAKHVVRN